MKYAFRWTTRRNGAVYLTTTEDYNRGGNAGQVGEGKAFSPNIDEAELFDSVTDAIAGIQERVENTGLTNSKLELVQVQAGGARVIGTAA